MSIDRVVECASLDTSLHFPKSHPSAGGGRERHIETFVEGILVRNAVRLPW